LGVFLPVLSILSIRRFAGGGGRAGRAGRPEVVVAFEVVVVLPVVVVGPGMHAVTQKTLCFTSAPWEPSALMVSLTWKPWLGGAR
jgi:hypothetical protein